MVTRVLLRLVLPIIMTNYLHTLIMKMVIFMSMLSLPVVMVLPGMPMIFGRHYLIMPMGIVHILKIMVMPVALPWRRPM